VLESLAALEAIEARELDGDPPRPACLDVLAQHIVGTACAQPIDARPSSTRCAARSLIATCRERTSTTPSTSSRPVATRSRAYERWHRLKQLPDGTGCCPRPWWLGSSA